MAKLLTTCPVCANPLQISLLHCSGCGLELKNNFEPSPFDRLDAGQTEFLMAFLQCKGNLSALQDALQISYPAAKKQLNELLETLGLPGGETAPKEVMDVKNWFTRKDSTQPSDIVKTKLKECGGEATVCSVTGKPYTIRAASDGKTLLCDALPPIYTYDVFDIMVALLKRSDGFRARKGEGRLAKVGDANCDENTVVGAIAIHYFGKQPGESTLDGVFVLAAVLEWAGIARNGRGYLELTAAYRQNL